MTEYRLEQLAHEANTTVRNIRAYRDRGLLPPPRRQGRIALYSDAHLARLRLVADLLGRGYTLNSIAELLEAWERGKDIGDVLGLEEALTSPWSAEAPIEVTRSELEALLPAGTTPDMLDEILDLGIIERVSEPAATPEDEGAAEERFRIVSLRELASGGELLAAGVSGREVLTLARYLHDTVDEIAATITELIRTRVFDPLGPLPPPDQIARLTKTVAGLRPLAQNVVEAELARAMERNIQKHLADVMTRAADGASPDP